MHAETCVLSWNTSMTLWHFWSVKWEILRRWCTFLLKTTVHLRWTELIIRGAILLWMTLSLFPQKVGPDDLAMSLPTWALYDEPLFRVKYRQRFVTVLIIIQDQRLWVLTVGYALAWYPTESLTYLDALQGFSKLCLLILVPRSHLSEWCSGEALLILSWAFELCNSAIVLQEELFFRPYCLWVSVFLQKHYSFSKTILVVRENQGFEGPFVPIYI